MACFALMTAQIVLIKCEAYIAMNAAVLLLGFGGSSLLKEYAINTMRYALSVAFKLFVMQLVLGIGMSFISDFNIYPYRNFRSPCPYRGRCRSSRPGQNHSGRVRRNHQRLSHRQWWFFDVNRGNGRRGRHGRRSCCRRWECVSCSRGRLGESGGPDGGL